MIPVEYFEIERLKIQATDSKSVRDSDMETMSNKRKDDEQMVKELFSMRQRDLGHLSLAILCKSLTELRIDIMIVAFALCF